MKTTAVLLLASLLLVACVDMTPFPPDPVPPPPVPDPVPPNPDPTPPPVPPVQDVYPRSTFESIAVGDPDSVLETLPPAARTVPAIGGRVVHAWDLDEPRPTGGGQLAWEIHTLDGKVVETFVW